MVVGLPLGEFYIDGQDGQDFRISRLFPLISVHLSRGLGRVMAVDGGRLSGFWG